MSATGAEICFRRKSATVAFEPWFALRTRSRQEKILAAELARAGIVTFVPLASVERVYAGMTALVETPLFPGFVFLQGSAGEAATAARSPRALQTVSITDSNWLDSELTWIDLALQGDARFESHAYPRDGVRARVVRGALRGVEGFIEDRANPTRLILGIRELRLAVSIAVSPDDLHIETESPRGINLADSSFTPIIPATTPPLAG